MEVALRSRGNRSGGVNNTHRPAVGLIIGQGAGKGDWGAGVMGSPASPILVLSTEL